MNLEEFKKKAEEISDWAPGWDAIEEVFSKLYPNQEPMHYATDITKRAIFGGNQFLDGFSFYKSPKGYWHLVTFGMTFLYVEEEQLGEEWNKWGYEMTMKLPDEDINECLYAADLLANIAGYTYKSEKYFDPYEFINCNGPIRASMDTNITALLTVPDTEAEGTDTLYGRTNFIQFVGITTEEYEMLKENPDKAEQLAMRIKEDYPDFVTDLNRTKSYLF